MNTDIAEPGSRTGRFGTVLMSQLTQGVTPQKLALTLSLGVTLGIFPILGATSLLCLLAGVWLRLNQPALQLANYVAYPAQLVLLVPFYRAGERLFSAVSLPLLSVGEMMSRFEAGPGQFLKDYGMIGLYGVTVWLLIAPILFVAAYLIMRPVLLALARHSFA